MREDDHAPQLGHGAGLDAIAEVFRGLEQRRGVLGREDHSGTVLEASLELIRGLVDALDRVERAEAVDHRLVGIDEVLSHGVERVLDADVGVVRERHLDGRARAALVLAELIDAALRDPLSARSSSRGAGERAPGHGAMPTRT